MEGAFYPLKAVMAFILPSSHYLTLQGNWWFLRERAAPDGTLVRALAHSRTGLECQSAEQDENIPEKGRGMKLYLLRLFYFFLMIPIKCQRSSRQILARWAYLLVFRQGGRRGLWNFICLPWWHCLMLSHLGCPEKCIFTASTMLFFFL